MKVIGLAALALLGAGDVVYDPANTEQTIAVLRQVQQEFDRLGSLLGVSTQTFDTLAAMAGTLGNAAEAAPYGQSPTPTDLQTQVQAAPGLSGSNLGALFTLNGWIDAFFGVPPANWSASTAQSDAAYRAILIAPAAGRSGGSTAPVAAAADYAQWYNGLSAEDRYNAARRAAIDFSALLAGDWLGNDGQRRVNLQALAAADQSARKLAAGAQTSADQQRAQAQVSASANAILLESAAQANEAAEAGVRALHSQGVLLQSQAEAARDAQAVQLDLAP